LKKRIDLNQLELNDEFEILYKLFNNLDNIKIKHDTRYFSKYTIDDYNKLRTKYEDTLSFQLYNSNSFRYIVKLKKNGNIDQLLKNNYVW